MRNLTIAVVLLILATSAFAQSSRILIPISIPDPTPGAYGSVWQSELWYHNGSAIPVGGDRNCSGWVPVEGAQCATPHPPGVTELERRVELLSPVNAVVLYVPSSVLSQVTLSNRLFELSRHTQPVGIDVPVVRESELFTGPVLFAGINGSSANRVSLRVYDPYLNVPDSGGGRVRVDVLSETGSVLASSELGLLYPGATFPATIFVPGYAAVYDLAAQFLQLNGVERYDVRVTPLKPGLRYYALMSATDYETQQVLLITTKD